MSTLIIAEAGVNHNGQEDLAFKLIDAAKKAGADIVKFQTFKAKELVTDNAKQCQYQQHNTGKIESQLSMLQRLELSYPFHHKLLDYCNKLGIEFLSTAFDSPSLLFLVDELNMKRLKIPSGEITNAPLLLEHARTNCDLIVSTGMTTIEEIEIALGVIAFGYTTDKSTAPSMDLFKQAYHSEDGKNALLKKVTLLHCTSEYPAPMEDVNLLALKTLKNRFNLPVGYSDHTNGITIPIAAVARGAEIIEKHFTLDKNMQGPDHKASLNPRELSEMVAAIRDLELAFGDGIKNPQPSERKNITTVRKSLVIAKDIIKGEILTEDYISIKRPGEGISPLEYWNVLGAPVTKSYKAGELLE